MADRPVTATLDLWEAAQGASGVERALALAAAAGGEGDLACLPLGRRDARLLALHETLGGPALEATASCAACGEQAEFSVDVSSLLAQEASEPAPVEQDGFVVAWRSPDSLDVAAAAAAGDAEAAERVLLSRCVPTADSLPAPVIEAVSAAMAAADPLAEVLVDVECPACGASFVADLDIADFVWSEVRAHAQRLLRDIDTLARAYGWTEEQVLALSERRREAYLELVEAGR